MKFKHILLVCTLPVMALYGFSPNNKIIENQYISSCIAIKTDGDFKLKDAPYYSKLFTQKELKTLKKGEKNRELCNQNLILQQATLSQAQSLERSQNTKKAEKLYKKAEAYELKALKYMNKAGDYFNEVYTPVLTLKTKDTSDINVKLAYQLNNLAIENYRTVKELRKNIVKENTQSSLRSIYAKLYSAIYNQETAFGLLNNEANLDLSALKPQENIVVNPDNGKAQNVVLQTKVKYDFDQDKNIIKKRYNEFKDALKVSAADDKLVQKAFEDDFSAMELMKKSWSLGLQADTFRTYILDAETLAEREYYDQKAQENEMTECSNLVKAMRLNVKSNNTLFSTYEKYIIGIRNDNQQAKQLEDTAVKLFNISKSYETLADKHYSMVEKYTTLASGNDIKLSAIENMENAIAIYLGSSANPSMPCNANSAINHHNEIAQNYADESGQEAPKVDKKDEVSSANNSKPEVKKDEKTEVKSEAKTEAKTDNKSQEADKKDVAQNNNSQNKTNKPANNIANSNKTASNKNNNSQAANKNTNSTTNNKVSNVKASEAYSNAKVVSSWFYSNDDQRLKPYSYPKGTFFSVEVGQFKEMVEPVDFQAVNKIICQKLDNQTSMRYYVGESSNQALAAKILANAKNLGYKDAKLVKFVNGAKSYVDAKDIPTVVEQNNDAINAENASKRYAIQFCALKDLKTPKELNVSDLYYEKSSNGLYVYFTGLTDDVNTAKQNLEVLKKAGYQDAYIVDIKNNSKVNINANQTTTYRVQLGAFKSKLTPQQEASFAKIKSQFGLNINKQGEYTVYSTKDYSSRQEAENARAALSNLGYKETYIATFVNGIKQ